MGFLDRMRGSYEAGKESARLQKRHAEERALRKKLRDEQRAKQSPNRAVAFAGRMSESPAAKFGKKAATATGDAAVKGLNWVMTGNTKGERKPAPAAPKKRTSRTHNSPVKVVYVAANPPSKRKRRTQKKDDDYWSNPPF